MLLNLAAALPACLVMLGLMGALDVPITMLSSFIPIIILVVGVCDTTHLLVHCHATNCFHPNIRKMGVIGMASVQAIWSGDAARTAIGLKGERNRSDAGAGVEGIDGDLSL